MANIKDNNNSAAVYVHLRSYPDGAQSIGFFCSRIVKELINGQLHQNDRMIYRTLGTEKTLEHITKESTGLPNHSTLLTMTRPSISRLCKIKVSPENCLKQRCMTFIITTCVLDLLAGPPYTSSLFLVIHSLLTIEMTSPRTNYLPFGVDITNSSQGVPSPAGLTPNTREMIFMLYGTLYNAYSRAEPS